MIVEPELSHRHGEREHRRFPGCQLDAAETDLLGDWPGHRHLRIAGVPAFTSLSMVPALAFYIIAERQIVSGLASGAVKG